jgi:predicted transcriptional regulator
MPKSITITVSDSAYEALQAAAKNAQQSPEELIVDAIARHYHLQDSEPEASPEREAREAILAQMRANGHLVEFGQSTTHSEQGETPPTDSPERAQWEDKIGDDLSQALEESGLDITDLIERR